MEDEAKSDFSCSSVDAFLRDNGFSISEHAGELSVAAMDEELTSESGGAGVADDSDGDDDDGRREHAVAIEAFSGRGHSSGSDDDIVEFVSTGLEMEEPLERVSATPPRFVLLEDDEFLVVDDHNALSAGARGQSEAGSATSEKDGLSPGFVRSSQRLSSTAGGFSLSPHDEGAGLSVYSDNGKNADESLDRSMLLGRSVVSASSSASLLAASGSAGFQFGESSGAAEDTLLESPHEQLGDRNEQLKSAVASSAGFVTGKASTPATPRTSDRQTPPIYQVTPQPDHISASSSSMSSGVGRIQDLELSHALGVQTPASARSTIDRSRPEETSGRDVAPSQVSGSVSRRRQASGTTDQRLPRAHRSLFSSGAESSQPENQSFQGHDGWDQYLAAGAQDLSSNTSSGFNGSRSKVSEPPVAREEQVLEGAWHDLNDLLRKNGLPVIQLQKATSVPADSPYVPDSASLFGLVQDFVAQLDRKNEIIQDLVLESKRNSRVQNKTEGTLASVEKMNQEAQSALNSARAEIFRVKAKLKEEKDHSDQQIKKLKTSCVRLQQQLKVSEHRVKAREVLVERMQQKVQQQVDKENAAKTRERQVFRQMQDRDPRRANARDNQSLETIRVFEAQREQLQEEVDTLKSQVASLNAELRDKENFIARKAASESAAPVWEEYGDDAASESESRRLGTTRNDRHTRGRPMSVASDEMIYEQLETARREQELVAAKLRHREAAMIKKVVMIEQDLVAARETIAELKEENANLVLEADSRPSIRDYRQCQRRVQQLERQLSDNKLALDEANDLNDLRKYMSTKELVDRDRLNHRLHLNRLSALPRETALEVVQEVCRILHLSDITLIAPNLQKLCNVVVAVPRMEKFIRDVCGFVFLHANEGVANDDIRSAQFELEQVLPTLQQWMAERKKLHSLEGFQAAVMAELCSRSVEPKAIENAEGNQSPQNRTATLANAAQIISELVELEKNVLQHREIYSQAATELERRPSVLINQIVRHFSRLFQVGSIEGVLPKINEIYLFVNEMENFLNGVRDLLGLRKQASVVQCVNAVRERLEKGSASARDDRRDRFDDVENAPFDNNPPNYVVDDTSRKPGAGRGGGGGGGGNGIAGVREVREMSILVRDLKRELGAATMQEILPRTKRLMELLSLSIHTANDPEDSDE